MCRGGGDAGNVEEKVLNLQGQLMWAIGIRAGQQGRTRKKRDCLSAYQHGTVMQRTETYLVIDEELAKQAQILTIQLRHQAEVQSALPVEVPLHKSRCEWEDVPVPPPRPPPRW